MLNFMPASDRQHKSLYFNQFSLKQFNQATVRPQFKEKGEIYEALNNSTVDKIDLYAFKPFVPWMM